jgi:hypothetical protein
MSYTEINARNGGLPYGGVPHDRILEKLEETDPDLVAQARGYDEFHDVEDEYNNYTRAEIIDWTPDVPYLESDQPRRDPALSRSQLNLRYNGTRGSNPELPRHPELFYGFTGNDPRGAVNDPRFDQIRGQMTSRAANLTVRMGDNDDHHLAERPWTGQAISYAMKDIQRRIKDATKVFDVQKVGRPWGRNVVADQFAARDLRGQSIGAGAESLAYQTGDFHESRFAAGDHAPAADGEGGGARGVDKSHFAGAGRAPWLAAVGEADLGVQSYGQSRGQGRALASPAGQGGGRARAGAADQDFEESRAGGGANRNTLAATMGLAARARRNARAGAPDQDMAVAREAGYAPGGGLLPARDLAALYRNAVEDQARRPATEVQDGDGGALGGSAGLVPSATTQRATRASLAATAANDHLTNAESIVAGLREGTAAGRRRIAGAVVADGARPDLAAEGATRGGLAPGRDYGRVAKLADAAVTTAAAASGLEVQTYRGATPRRDHRARDARAGDDPSGWRPSHVALPVGKSKMPEWRSATKDPVVLGDDVARTFGIDAEVHGYHGAGKLGTKSLRASGWSNSMNLSDEVGERAMN